MEKVEKKPKIHASNPARDLAVKLGVSLIGIEGTGPTGRIMSSDVSLAAKVRSNMGQEDGHVSQLQSEGETPEVGGSKDEPSIETETEVEVEEEVETEAEEEAETEAEAEEEAETEAEAEEEVETEAEEEVETEAEEEVETEAEEEVETEAEEEVETEAEAMIDVISEPSPVTNRIVMMMIDRRTGSPVRENCTLFGSAPIHSIDSVMPVVAIRQDEASPSGEAFNSVIPEHIFSEIFAGGLEVGPDVDRSLMKIGLFSFDNQAQDRLRFSKAIGDDGSFGRGDLERGAKNWAMSMLANPHVTEGVYNMKYDVPGRKVVPQNGDIESAAAKAAQNPAFISRSLGIPTLNELGMERYLGDDKVPGESLWGLSSEHLSRTGGLDAEGGFRPYSIRGLFTNLDKRIAQKQGGVSNEIFSDMEADGEIELAAIPASNFRDFIIGKFVAGVQLGDSDAVRAMRMALNLADEMNHKPGGFDPVADQKAVMGSIARINRIAQGCVVNRLAPRFINSAITKAARDLRVAPPESVDQWAELAIRTTEGGAVTSDAAFGMAHANAIAKGKHPRQGELSPLAKRASHFASLWYEEALRDCLSAISGLRSFFMDRTGDGDRIRVNACKLDAQSLAEQVKKMKVRPSFYVFQGPPIQVWDTDLGGRIPAHLGEYFRKRR